jgi:plasmid stabilization system protein ParE
MTVLFSAAAEADIESIVDFIAADSPSGAGAFVRQLRDRCDRLALSARRYPIVPRYTAAKIRRCVYRDYLIFYRIFGSNIEVLHVLHGARDYEAILDVEK